MASGVSGSSVGIPIDKLKGMEDYNNWKFIMKMILIHEDLYETIESEDCKDERKKQKALAKICLSVGPSALQHVRNAKTAYEAWTCLQKAYEDRGLCRRLGLLRSLFGVKLKEMEGMQAYITRVTELAQQLADIGSPLDDEFVAVILLSGLTSDFDPLIMALENSDSKLTSEVVKSKLMLEQLRRDDKEVPDVSALATKKVYKCFRCKKAGHMKKDCPMKGSYSVGKDKPKKDSSTLLTALSVYPKRQIWYVDSGCTNHMCNSKDQMMDFERSRSTEVNVANGESIFMEGKGRVCVNLKKLGYKTISNVYYVPALSTNLLSVSELSRKGYRVIFTSTECRILDGGRVVATATCNNGLYELDCYKAGKRQSERAMTSFCVDGEPDAGLQGGLEAAWGIGHKVSQEIWHRRLAHLNSRSMNLMKNGLVTGMDYDVSTFNPCVPCIEGKQPKLPFSKKSYSRSKELLGLVHTDVCGPMQVPSLGGMRYFVTFIDDFSRKTFIYFLKRKVQVFEKFKLFKALAENQTGKKLKVLRSDNGGEYVNHVFQEYLENCGVKHETTIPKCSSQNGVAERGHRCIMDKVRCMLQDSGLEKHFWAEAANTAVYLKNRSPTKAVMGLTPEEAWTSKKTNVAHLRVFGCLAYAVSDKCRKLDPRSKKYVFVGYCDTSKGYRLVDPSCPKTCIKARHVVFLENSFINKNVSNGDKVVSDSIGIIPMENSTIPLNTSVTPGESGEQSLDTSVPLSDEMSGDRNLRRQTVFSLNETDDFQVTDHSSDPTYIPGSSSIDSDESAMTFEDADQSVEFAGLVGTTGDDDFPVTAEQALSSGEAAHWRKAMIDEYDSFIQNKCWSLVDLPKGHKAVKCKWIFTKKRGLNNELLRYKARLVAKGFTQRYGVDYYETFSPVVRYSTIRILLALAAQYDMVIEHLDVKTAFLNGDLTEIVYMEQPEGFIDRKNREKVYLLHKAIYGLKQAAKAWYEKINNVLVNKLGFRRLSSEQCVYVYNQDGEIVFIALYVDDILLFSIKNSRKRDIFKKQLKDEFKMNDLCPSNHILGMKITRNLDGKFTLDQSSYIKKILDKFNMSDCKPCQTPMEVGLKLEKSEDNDYNNNYRSIIGYLMYLAVCSRPDIAHSVCYLSQFNNCNSESHWKAAKRVLRYLKGTSGYHLSFEKGNLELVGYTDADWGGDQSDRRSYTGYCFSLNKSIISWECRKQRTVALSSAEAEYMAISDSCKEGLFLQTFIRECTGVECSISLFNDNQSAQKICCNTLSHSRTKHIDIRHHFVKDLINKNVVSVSYVSTEEMVADVLTKSLCKDKHMKCISKMLNIS